jgi:hypothetical protein
LRVEAHLTPTARHAVRVEELLRSLWGPEQRGLASRTCRLVGPVATLSLLITTLQRKVKRRNGVNMAGAARCACPRYLLRFGEVRRHLVDDPVRTRRTALLKLHPHRLNAIKLDLNMHRLGQNCDDVLTKFGGERALDVLRDAITLVEATTALAICC